MASSVCCSLSSLSFSSVSYLFNVVINVHVNMHLDLCQMSVESSCTLIFDKSIFDPKAEYFRYGANMTESSHRDEAGSSSFKDFGAELSAALCMDGSKEQPDV